MPQRAQRLIEAARKLPVPEGTYAVGLGLLISGITAYGFQILAFKGLTKSEYAALNGLWILVFVVAPGFFLPLEQEVGRAVADRRARAIGGGPVVRKAAQAGLLLAVSLMVLSVVGFEAFGFTDRLFHGQEVLLVCFVIALGTYAVQHITRGTLSGNGRFGPYGMILGAEGVFRIVPVIVVYAAGFDDLLWYGLALAIPPVLASMVSVWGQHGLVEPGPDAEWSELSTNLTLLFLGSLAAQALSYAAALGVLVLAQGKGERDAAADFIVGFFIARIPILLFQAIQAALLPKLAALSGAGKHADFRSGLKKLVVIVLGVGALGVVAGATIGPTVGEILFGDKFNLGSRDLTLLFLGSAAFILALTLAQALIALLGHARALIAWAVGLVLCVGVMALGSSATIDDLFLRVELGYLAGCLGAAAMMTVFLLARLRAHGPESLRLLVEAIEHEPLEI
jgi:O-antigen/teichoic acid export membrane protein